MGTWFDDLEARLNQQLEAFLQANPAQQTRLEQQEAQERQEQLGRTRLQLQQQAQQQRQRQQRQSPQPGHQWPSACSTNRLITGSLATQVCSLR